MEDCLFQGSASPAFIESRPEHPFQHSRLIIPLTYHRRYWWQTSHLAIYGVLSASGGSVLLCGAPPVWISTNLVRFPPSAYIQWFDFTRSVFHAFVSTAFGRRVNVKTRQGCVLSSVATIYVFNSRLACSMCSLFPPSWLFITLMFVSSFINTGHCREVIGAPESLGLNQT